MSEQIRKQEMSFGQILAMAKEIYTTQFKTFVYILVLVFFPVCVLSELIQYQVIEIENTIDFEMLRNDFYLMLEFAQSPEYLKLLVYNILNLAVQVFCMPLGLMAVVWIAHCAIEKEQINYKTALIKAFEKVPSMILAGIIYTLLVGIGSAFFVLPGLFLGYYFSFYQYALILNQDKAIASLSSSRKTFQNRFFKVMGIVILFNILRFSFEYGIAQIFSWGWGIFAVDVFSDLLGYLILIFFYIAEAIFFLNRKYRTQMQ